MAITTEHLTELEETSHAPPGKVPMALTMFLRIIGALVLVSSLSVFLFQGWGGADGLFRFLSLIGFSGLLTVAGLGCAKLIGENIGARFFLGIALLSVVVNFAVAGSLIYSQFGAALAAVSMPNFAVWQLASDIPTVVIALGALAALTPISILAFRALARQSSNHLFRLFILGNAMLLLPIREGNLVAIIGAIALVFVWRSLLGLRKTDPALMTLEGRFAKTLTFLPIFVMIGRSLLFYEYTTFALAILCGLSFFAIRELALRFDFHQSVKYGLDVSSVVTAFFTAIFATNFTDQYFANTDAFNLPILCVIFAAALTELSLRSQISGQALRKLSAGVLTVGLSANLLIYPSFAMALITMLIGLVIMSCGASAENKLMFASGAITTVVGLIYELFLVSGWFYFGNWATLAVVGVVIILAASYIEKHGGSVVKKAQRWRENYLEWQN